MGNMRRTTKAASRMSQASHHSIHGGKHVTGRQKRTQHTLIYIYNIPHSLSVYVHHPAQRLQNRAAGIPSYIISFNLSSLRCCNKNQSPYIQTPPMISHQPQNKSNSSKNLRLVSCRTCPFFFFRKWGSRFASVVQYSGCRRRQSQKETQKSNQATKNKCIVSMSFNLDPPSKKNHNSSRLTPAVASAPSAPTGTDTVTRMVSVS